MPLLDKARQTIARFNMLRKGDRVLVGVSGGCDSTALLFVLNAIKEEFNLKLFVAHLNHMIRKSDAEKDALFVKRAAEKLKLPVVIESKDVPRISKDLKLSIEEAARNARYDFYLEAAKKFNANKIALGHTEDDQAETVLMRLVRGAGLLGLSGIPPKRDFEGRTIIRPLIEISKKEVKKFLRQKKISFREDLTNTQPIYFRNKIRQKLIPLLEKEFNPDIKKILAETGKNLRTDYGYLLKISELKFKKYARVKRGVVEIDLEFLKEDTAVQRMIIREAIRRIKGNLDAVGYGHWEDIDRLLGKKGRWAFHLPGGVILRRVRNKLVFSKKDLKTKEDYKDVSYQLNAPARVKIPGINKTIEADFVKGPMDFRRKKSKREEYFDFEKLKPPLCIRFRREKDKIKPLGMDRYKRLKRLFIDEKVPFEKRHKVPLIFSGNMLIWAAGVKRADYARVTAKTKKVVRLRVK